MINGVIKLWILNYTNKFLVFVFITGVFHGCEGNTNLVSKKNEDKIQIFYLSDDLDPISSIDCCGEIFAHNTLKDTLIVDKEWIVQFRNRLKEATESEKNYNFDFRVYARLIVNNNQDTTHVCFGRNQVFRINETKNYEDSGLVILIRKLLYNRSWLFE